MFCKQSNIGNIKPICESVLVYQSEFIDKKIEMQSNHGAFNARQFGLKKPIPH